MESKIVFPRMLAYFLDRDDMTMKELGDKMGKTKSAVSRWVSGENQPKVDDIEKLVDIFDTDIQTLIFGGDGTYDELFGVYEQLNEQRQENVLYYAEYQLDQQNSEINEPQLSIITGRSTAAGPARYVDDADAEVITASMVPKGADELVRVKGKSMEPLIRDGDNVYIRHQPTLEQGEVGIISIENEGVTCKKFYLDGDTVVLRSVNDDYEDMKFDTSQIRILGKVLL